MKGTLLAFVLAAVMAWAQENPPLFRASSDLVLLDVSVIHRKTGAPAVMLSAGDLQLSEDGSRQQISFFSRDQLPLSIIVLFDLTDSSRLVLRSLAASRGRHLQR